MTVRRRKEQQKPLHKGQSNFSTRRLKSRKYLLFLRSLLTEKAMAVTRLKRKNRKDKAKSAVRRQSLKLQNFKPVIKTVDVEKIKEEFKAKKA